MATLDLTQTLEKTPVNETQATQKRRNQGITSKESKLNLSQYKLPPNIGLSWSNLQKKLITIDTHASSYPKLTISVPISIIQVTY